jgi:hypothetical protein
MRTPEEKSVARRAWDAEVEAVRAAERADIVAWLRGHYGRPGARTATGRLVSEAARAMAEAIEAGEHLGASQEGTEPR